MERREHNTYMFSQSFFVALVSRLFLPLFHRVIVYSTRERVALKKNRKKKKKKERKKERKIDRQIDRQQTDRRKE